MTAAPVIEARGLVRRYGAVRAVDGVDLLVEPGEAVTVFGPNGAGKSTLLKILAGILRPREGTLRVFGEPVHEPSVRRRTGVVGHGSFLYPELGARENLELYAGLFGLPDAGRRIDRVLDDVGLGPWQNRRTGTFSRGMEQRLSLARAFLHEPELLLLDEPWSGLDPLAGGHLREILARRHLAGTTIVLTSHDVTTGLEICDRALLLVGGRIVWASERVLPAASEMIALYAREVEAARRVSVD